MIKNFTRYNFMKQSLIMLLGVVLLVSGSLAQSMFDDLTLDKLVKTNIYLEQEEVQISKTVRGALTVDIKEHWHINSSNPYQDYLIPASISFEPVSGVTVDNILFPESDEVVLLGDKMSVYEGEVVIYFDILLSSDVSETEFKIPVKFEYQACNNSECRAPQIISLELPIKIGDNNTLINQAQFADYSDELAVSETTTSTESIEDESEIVGLVKKYGFWGYLMALGLAFLTGLLLSFSPCTYPMIPITVSIFAGQQRSLWKGFTLSLVYVGTMALVYGIMGLVVSMIGGVFGAWLANPAVVITIAVIFVIFSLSMFGLFELQVPGWLRNKMGTTKTGSGIGGVMVLGVVAALVVSPCVGPFVGGILLYISTFQSPIFGFLTLFVFAMGLGTLYIIIGTFSSSINNLPKAGDWMDQIKKFFGFVLLLMAIYFLKTVISESLVITLTALLLIVFAVFGGGFDRLTSEASFFHRLKKLLGLLAFITGLYLLLGNMLLNGFMLPKASQWLPVGTSVQAEQQAHINWTTDLDSGLSAAKAAGRPVIIDTWATWCVNCKVLEKKTLTHPDVVAAAKRFAPLKIQLEKQSSDETKHFMELFNIKAYSLPTIFLIDSQGNLKKKIQGVIKPEDLIIEMNKIK